MKIALQKTPEDILIRAGLGRCPMFSGLSDQALSKICSIAAIKRFAKKEIIFYEGDPAGGFFVVLSGQIKIYKAAPDGKIQVLHILGAPSSFAEATMFMGRYPATAQAARKSKLAFFEKNLFLNLAEKDSRLVLSIIVSLSRWLQHMTNMIESLTLKSVPARLGAFVLELDSTAQKDAKGALPSPLSKTALAGLLGTTKETLSRMLQKFSKSRVFLFRGQAITILNRKKLEAVAQGLEKL
ncbi:MAG: Crp/Fnr family transcriptional regulator [Elusimicrobia bacterium]|nr:Crp/Fnr family transcriptional regulator [Elusimicrobiota bacterium]